MMSAAAINMHSLDHSSGRLLRRRDALPVPTTQTNQWTPNALISIGTAIVWLSVLGFILTTVLAYVVDDRISMTSQIMAHIGMMVTAGTLKLGYVLKLSGHRSMFLRSGKANA